MTLKRAVHIWFPQKQPSPIKAVSTYAVCGCGIHAGVRACVLICPECLLRGVKETPDGKPGEFTVKIIYSCSTIGGSE